MNANQLNDLRDQVKNYIDRADTEVVQMVHALLKMHAEDAWWWENMSTELKTNLHESIYQADQCEETSYEQVKQQYPHWFMN